MDQEKGDFPQKSFPPFQLDPPQYKSKGNFFGPKDNASELNLKLLKTKTRPGLQLLLRVTINSFQQKIKTFEGKRDLAPSLSFKSQ